MRTSSSRSTRPRVVAEDLKAAADEPIERPDRRRPALPLQRAGRPADGSAGRRPIRLAVDPEQFHFFDPETGATLRGGTRPARGERVEGAVLYLMCGLAYSGKTTLARAIVEFTGATPVSLDDINRERGLAFGGEGIPVEEWERTYRVAMGRVEQLMRARATVLVDDTSNLRFLRDRVRASPGSSTTTSCSCTSRPRSRRSADGCGTNAQQPGRPSVRAYVFAEHVRTFEHPAEDERAVVFTPDQPVDEWLRATLGSPARERQLRG